MDTGATDARRDGVAVERGGRMGHSDTDGAGGGDEAAGDESRDAALGELTRHVSVLPVGVPGSNRLGVG